MSAKYLNAISFDANGKPFKHHNIKDCSFSRDKFKLFAKNKLQAIYVNWYDSKTKQFVRREQIG